MSAAKATGSAWKLPPETIASLRQHQRVVGRGVRLDLERARRPAQSRSRRRRSPAAGSGCSRGPARGCRPRGGSRGSPSPPCSAAHRRGRLDLARDGRAARGSPARSGAVEPMIASVDIAEMTSSAFCAARQAPKRPASAQAVENCVPLISASPSFAASTTGARPGRGQRLGARHARGRRSSASPSPSITAAMCASGARSPEAPTEPCDGMTGEHARWRASPRSARPARQRTPEAPRPSETSFSAIISRTIAGRRRLADAAAVRQDQVALQRARCRSAGILTLASLPKPVLTP